MRAIDSDHSRTCSPSFTHMVSTIRANGRCQQIENFDKNYEKDKSNSIITCNLLTS